MSGSHTLQPVRPSVPPPDDGNAITRLLRRIPTGVLIGAGAVLLAALIPLSLLLSSHAASETTRADSNAAVATSVKQQAAPLAGQVQSVCSQGGEAAQALSSAGACEQASRVQSAVQIPGPSGARGATGPGPSQDQINAAVAAYCAPRNGCTGPSGSNASVAMVTAAVASYLEANPPAPGRPPTAQEIADAVSGYCDGHGGCSGPAGATGAAGQNATDAQVDQAVNDFCIAHNGCMGPAGPTGAPGATGQQGPPPSTYTVLVPGLTGSTTETCTRTNTDDNNPAYACS